VQNILIVDDRVENLRALEKILERPGLNIKKATSGNEALALLLEHDFALVLLDVRMPEMDGFETAELMRGNKETKRIPIIFVTAISKEQKHVFKGYESGAVDYLFKPLDPDILKSKVNIFLELYRQKMALEQANRELNLARQAAERANHAKSEFLANMSYEFRTPMNGVIGMTGLLLDTDLTPGQREFVETVRSNADNLLRVINDILDFSRMDTGKLDLETLDFNLHTSLEVTSELMGVRAQEKGLKFVCLVEPEVPSLFRGDPGRLRQVITNLVKNAIKFTHQGEVALEVSLDHEDDRQAMVRFTVTDTGIGIPKNRQKSIFDAFTQVDGSITRRYGGTGLGLTISKQLVETMGGKIGVKSREGKGATFWFTALFDKRPLPPGPVKESMGDIKGVRILVVDDNAVNRRLDEIGFAAYLPKPVKQSLLYECLVTVHSSKLPAASKTNQRLVTRHSITEARQRKVRIDDEDLVKELIHDFIEEIPSRFIDLKKALDKGDAGMIRHQGHTIKGTSGSIGAIALQKVAARLEAAGESGDMETAASLLMQLQEQLEIFKKETKKE
jgi:signal transduction histidine kinase/HPt (histidine-containing phosphotransfer) domain-containing protein